MSNKQLFSIKLNEFLQNLNKKKQYISKLKIELNNLQYIKQKNYKCLYHKHLKKNFNYKNYQNNLIAYIIDITFSKSNTLLHLMNSSGEIIFFCSAGLVKFKGKKSKKRRFLVFKNMCNILLTRFKFLKKQPIALHLKNVGFSKHWLIKKLKSKFFIKIIKIFTMFPYNGCRKKKIRRKKFRTKKIRKKGN